MLSLIITLPLVAVKSAVLLADRLLTAQFNEEPDGTLVVVTIKDIGEPSLTEVALPAAATAYVAATGVRLESLIII